MKLFTHHILTAASLLVSVAYLATAQTTLSGTVTDAATREGLGGARVSVKGSNNGVLSSLNGRFTLKAASPLAPTDVIVVARLGYRPQEIPVSTITSDALAIALQEAVITSQQVAVTASRQQQLRSEMPTAISVVSKQLIEDTKPAMIFEVMNKVPGVNMQNLGNEQHSMAIRSPLTTRALFLYLEDGIPIRTTGVFQHNALMEINLPAMRSIEVIKGPGSALYGANAIAGAVNFLTQRASARPVLEIGAQADNFGYVRGNWQLSNTFNDIGAVGSALGIYTGGYVAQQKTSWREYNSMDKFSLNVRADYRLSEQTSLEAAYSVNNLRTDMPGGIDSAMYFSKNYPSNNFIAYRDNRSERARLTLDHTFDENSGVRANVFFRSNQLLMLPSFRLRDDRTNARGAFGERSDTRFTSLGVDAQYRTQINLLGIETKLLAGVYYDNSPHSVTANFVRVGRESRNGSSIYTSASITDSLLTSYNVGLENLAGYAQAEMQLLPVMKFIAGLRHDRLVYGFKNNLPPSAFTGAPDQTTSYNNVAPRFGFIANLDPTTGLYANYSVGFLPPELSELFRGVRVPNLTQASFNNYEVGGWWSLWEGRAFVDASAYWMDGQNEVISVQVDQNVYENRNAGATRHYGVEFQVGITPVDEVSIRIGGTWARHIFTSYRERVGSIEQVFDNKDMPQAPNWVTYSEITYKPTWLAGFRIGAELQTQGQYFQDTQNSSTYAGHAVVHLRAGYKVGGADFFVNVLNVFNTLYAESSSRSAFGYSYSPGNPRLISVGAAYNFGTLLK